MKFRAAVAATFSLLGFLAILWGTRLGVQDAFGAVWVNVGTEVIGIAITVAIVDWLFEWRRRQGEARALARRILGELDYTVWVWQGGRRESSVYELNDLLRMIKDHHLTADCTDELLFMLGCEAQAALGWQEEIVAANKDLRAGLAALKHLVSLRDSGNGMTTPHIRTHLQSAMAPLARAAGLESTWISSKPENRLHDPAPDEQIRRRFGQPSPQSA